MMVVPQWGWRENDLKNSRSMFAIKWLRIMCPAAWVSAGDDPAMFHFVGT
jgi:hypothetical protein